MRRPLLLVLLALVAGVFIAAIGVLAVQVARQIEELATAQSDSGQWTLSQIDIEALTLLLATRDAADVAAPDPDAAGQRSAALAALRRRFDIFYSRADTLRLASLVEGLRSHPNFLSEMVVIEAFVRDTVPLIDGDDATLTAGLGRLTADLMQVRKATRIITLTGLEVLSADTEAKRSDVRRTLILAASLTTALVLMLSALVVALWRLERSNHRRAEETQTALTRMAAIVGAAHDAVIVADWQGRIVDFNAAAEALFGHSRAEAVGSFARGLLAPDPSMPISDATMAFENGLRAAGINIGRGRQRRDVRRRDGSEFPAEMSVTAIGTDRDRLFVIFLRDLSADVIAARALTAARDEALAGERSKAQLLVVMSHEIRTPLNGLIGTLDLMEDGPLDPDQRAHHQVLSAAAQLLLQHVNNVLDITRLDHGALPVALEPVDLGALVGGILANQQAAARGQGTTLTLDLPPPDQRRVMADPGLLRQLLLNLIGNAVKFTRQGAITVTISHLGPAGPTSFAVTDTGIGIAAADLSRVFDDFVMLDASYARVAGGTGLGLGIVRRIVQGLGGSVAARSEPGLGSRFSFDLPLTLLPATGKLPPPEPAPAVRTVPAQTVRLRLLLVEDNDANRIIARAMLQRDGHEVVEAHDGEEAVRLAAALRFDAVVMDISMPGLDGLQATRAIRTGAGASALSPVIALTAHAMADEIERFRQGGMRDVLIKPLTRAKLAAALAGLAAPPAESPAAPLVRRDVLATLREDMGADQAGRLVTQFLAEGQAVLSSLSQGPVPPLPELSRALHKLAGAAGLFGASRLHRALDEAETACKAGDVTVLARLPALQNLWRDTATAYRLA